jgi:hypothetical protein
MSVSILIRIVGGDGLAPVCSAFEVDVLGVGSGIDNVNIDALSSISGIEVFIVIAE